MHGITLSRLACAEDKLSYSHCGECRQTIHLTLIVERAIMKSKYFLNFLCCLMVCIVGAGVKLSVPRGCVREFVPYIGERSDKRSGFRYQYSDSFIRELVCRGIGRTTPFIPVQTRLCRVVWTTNDRWQCGVFQSQTFVSHRLLNIPL